MTLSKKNFIFSIGAYFFSAVRFSSIKKQINFPKNSKRRRRRINTSF